MGCGIDAREAARLASARLKPKPGAVLLSRAAEPRACSAGSGSLQPASLSWDCPGAAEICARPLCSQVCSPPAPPRSATSTCPRTRRRRSARLVVCALGVHRPRAGARDAGVDARRGGGRRCSPPGWSGGSTSGRARSSTSTTTRARRSGSTRARVGAAPRSRSRVGSLSRADSEASADDGEDGEDEEAAAGAASDLVALSTGVRLPEAEQQFALWGRAVERCAYEGVARATRRGARTDSTQHLRYMLIQSLHRTVVRSLLQRPAEAHSHGALWKMRATAMAGAPMPPLPKATLELLAKHSTGGLTNSYQKHVFGDKKSNLAKVAQDARRRGAAARAAAAADDGGAARAAPPAADGAAAPPARRRGGRGERRRRRAVGRRRRLGASLALISGSLLTLLQLPRAVHCRGAKLGAVPLAQRLYALQRRVEGVASPRGRVPVLDARGGLNLYQAPPGEADALPAADAALAVLAAGATLASNVWDGLRVRDARWRSPAARRRGRWSSSTCGPCRRWWGR